MQEVFDFLDDLEPEKRQTDLKPPPGGGSSLLLFSSLFWT